MRSVFQPLNCYRIYRISNEYPSTESGIPKRIGCPLPAFGAWGFSLLFDRWRLKAVDDCIADGVFTTSGRNPGGKRVKPGGVLLLGRVISTFFEGPDRAGCR